MFFKKEKNSNTLLEAINSCSVDNVLKGGNLISNLGAFSESDKGAIQRINNTAAQLMEYAKGETDKLSMVNEIINSGMWEMYFDPESGEINRVIWSDEFRRMIGFNDTSDFPDTLEAWTGKLHPEDKDMVLSEFSATLGDKTNTKKYDVNYRLKTKSGEYRWYRAAGNLSRNANGIPVIFIGIFIDITEQV